jgi:urea transport system permease protein
LPEGWLYFLGALFILVVMAMPNGLAGVLTRLWDRRIGAEGK